VRLSRSFGARVTVRGHRHLRGVWLGRFTFVLLCVLGFLLGMSVFPALADPVPFAVASGSCSPSVGLSDFAVGIVAASPSDVLARFQATAGPGSLSWSGSASFQGADTVWFDWGAPDWRSGSFYCSWVPFVYSISFYAAPQIPVSFSGVSTPDPQPSPDSQVAFMAKATEHYAADLALSQGTATLTHDDFSSTQKFASSGIYDLGLLAPGHHTVNLIANDGPQAKWQIGIRALPVAITNLTLSQAFTRPGRLVTATYTVSGDTAISASVVNSSGVGVRSLGEGFPAVHGAHTLTWDALNSAGKPVSDGRYELVLNSVDPYGNTTSARHTVTVDTRPPTVTFQFGPTISPLSGVVFAITDRLSGFKRGWVTIDGGSSGYHVARAGTSRFIVTAPGGWSRGNHVVTVMAQDAVGNQTRISRNFRVR
jgi:hypothetical protein